MKVALSRGAGKMDVVEVESVDEAEQKYGERVLGYVVSQGRSVGMSTVIVGTATVILDEIREVTDGDRA